MLVPLLVNIVILYSMVNTRGLGADNIASSRTHTYIPMCVCVHGVCVLPSDGGGY